MEVFSRFTQIHTSFKSMQIYVNSGKLKRCSIDMWGLWIVVVGKFNSYTVNMRFANCRARQIEQGPYKWIGFVFESTFQVCSQILYQNRNHLSISTCANMVKQF